MRAVEIIDQPWREPLEVSAPFADEPWTVLLLSDGSAGRWSYLLRRPAWAVQLAPEDVRDPFEALRLALGPPAPGQPGGPAFQGGAAGLAAYELGARTEPLDLARLAPWPDLAFGVYPALLAFDHRERRVSAVGRGADAVAARARAENASAWLAALAEPPPPPAGALAATLEVDDPALYEAAVADVTRRIAAGEIFQANIARRWRGRLGAGARPHDLLLRLADASPAPFAAYLRLPALALVSNSPERFLWADAEGRVETRPIKGTRPRGRDPAEDGRLAAELVASAKDRAENLMIVDLMRNDLARVCAAGSIHVPDLFSVESYSNVHHLVSTVTGRLRHGAAATDLLCAAFPPGSVTGAPKVQAMRVIAGHEPPRGPYCGSLFWAGFDGAFDSSVLIRTAAFQHAGDGWLLEARAGAGIVADSRPVAERLETEAKIAAIRRALLGEAH